MDRPLLAYALLAFEELYVLLCDIVFELFVVCDEFVKDALHVLHGRCDVLFIVIDPCVQMFVGFFIPQLILLDLLHKLLELCLNLLRVLGDIVNNELDLALLLRHHVLEDLNLS